MERNNMLNISLLKHLYDQCMEPVVEAYDIKRIDLDILLFLSNHPTHDTASDIIQLRGLTKSHVSSSIQRLLHKQLIHAEKKDGDKKKIHLYVLPSSEAIIKDGIQAQEKFFHVLIKDFSKEEVETLQRLFMKIENNIQQHKK